ncbi:MAG: hypothetical protein LKG24_02960 [Lacticaseibacillus songhuajiangensis]|nr:hypothetical protein [Lacticaseibacillus songhuajiangensis]
MEITFTNPTFKRVSAKVWHNDELHTLHDGEKLELNVQQGDVVKYKVGALSAVRTISVQSNKARFMIEQDKKTQMYGFALIFLLILAMYFTKFFQSTVASTIGAVVVLAVFETFLYFRGYKITILH